MKKAIFKVLSKINKSLLPSYIHKDLGRLSTIDKAIVGYRYWVTKQYLDSKKQG